jgi:hypothetical protein
MTSINRPYEERPAARPIQPEATPLDSQDVSPEEVIETEPLPLYERPKKRLGCLGWSLIIIAIVIFISVLVGSFSDSNEDTSASTDPIEQVQVVLEGAYTYDEISSISSSAIASYGLPATDESISMIWSAVLSVTDGSTVKAWDVMTCAQTRPDPSVDFPFVVAICFTDLKFQ